MVKREFGVAPELKKLYLTYLTGLIAACFLWWIIPFIVTLTFFIDPFVGMVAALFTLIPFFVIVVVVLYWIPKFTSSVRYSLEDDRIVVDKGVWWKTKSVVPYNRITNINIYQGPISRRFGLGRLAIQTAGFSGVDRSGNKTAEADIFGIKNFEEIKDVVIEAIKGITPTAVEAGIEGYRNVNEAMLNELQRIRKAVEKET